MTIEVFKTNINHAEAVKTAIAGLKKLWPLWKINVDLNDCDNILRIEAPDSVDTALVSTHLLRIGYFAEVLE